MKNGRRSIVSYVHLWWGRILMPLGVINGGLGLALAHKTGGIAVAYAVISVIVYLAYLVIKVVMFTRQKMQTQPIGRKYSQDHGDEVPMYNYGNSGTSNRQYIESGK